MDIELEYEDEREKEMNLEIGGLTIEIPEKLIQERMDLLKCESMEINLQEIKEDILYFISCAKDKMLSDKELQSLIVDYIESEVDLFR